MAWRDFLGLWLLPTCWDGHFDRYALLRPETKTLAMFTLADRPTTLPPSPTCAPQRACSPPCACLPHCSAPLRPRRMPSIPSVTLMSDCSPPQAAGPSSRTRCSAAARTCGSCCCTRRTACRCAQVLRGPERAADSKPLCPPRRLKQSRMELFAFFTPTGFGASVTPGVKFKK